MSEKSNKNVTQAVIIVENDVERFGPVANGTPIALFPLANACMLDYVLESLSTRRIEQTYVYCLHDLQQVREHVTARIAESATWSVRMDVRVVGNSECRTYGDALRDIDRQHYMRGDFVLLGTDTINCVDFRTLLAQHKELAQNDSGVAATLIYKETATAMASNNGSNEHLLLAVDSRSKRLYHHERVPRSAPKFKFPTEVFMQHNNVLLVHDPNDPQIAIASQALLTLFSENFDYHTRDDFVSGVLKGEELHDKRLYVRFLPALEYAERATNWLAYQAISTAVLRRSLSPLLPENGICSFRRLYTTGSSIWPIYKGCDVITKGAKLEREVMLGQDTTVGSGSKLTNTITGPNSRIGRNCRLQHAYIMENVSIGDGCTLEHCVIGPNTEVADNCSITAGSIVGASISLPAGTQLASRLLKSNQQITTVEEKTPSALLMLRPSASSDDDIEDIDDTTSSVASDSESVDECGGVNGIDGVDGDDDNYLVNPSHAGFSEEINDLLCSYIEDGDFELDNALIEIRNTRHAYNILSMTTVSFLVSCAFFKLEVLRTATRENFGEKLKLVFDKLGCIIERFVHSSSDKRQTMHACLQGLANAADSNELLLRNVSGVVLLLYNLEYVDEQAIRDWCLELERLPEFTALRARLTKIIEFLDQSTEEESDEE